MNAPILLPKEDPGIPDSYKIKITYITGRTEEYDVASQYPINPQMQILEFWTAEDLNVWIELRNVVKIEYDKNWSKMIAIREKMLRAEREKQEKEKGNLTKIDPGIQPIVGTTQPNLN